MARFELNRDGYKLFADRHSNNMLTIGLNVGTSGRAMLVGEEDAIRFAQAIIDMAGDLSAPIPTPAPVVQPVIQPLPVPATPLNSGFRFGVASERELEGVKPQLVLCARTALVMSTQDFCVYDGIRSYKEQQQHVRNGTSKTMDSLHLRGLALDLVPWIDGRPQWDWNGCYRVVWAMDQAATKLGFAKNIRWGGVWDRRLSDFGNNPEDYKKAVEDYARRNPGKTFLDGPHFEWRD